MLTYLRHFRRSFHRLRYIGTLVKPGGSSESAKPRGFTLIELLVVVSIMLIITSTVLIRQSRFDSSTLARSLGYSIALSIRSAQVYGTSVRGTATTQVGCLSGNYAAGQCFAPAYGVYFNSSSSYLLYADLNNNGAYDSGTDAMVQNYQIGGGFQISQFCGILAGGTKHCNTTGDISSLAIYFKRPNPDALFVSSSPGDTYTGAYIQINALNDPTNLHCITVSQTGEIAVMQPSQC